ncbi:MAG TPA: FmdB family zinc ribbon protein [Actinomycetota bacterium]|nr:FmdB family zinc ribbon protein [Actinomycetota bacterium]
MPTYEYQCTACGQQIEVFQRITEDPLTTCGVCGGPLRKVFHPAGIVFKGSGFYATDSRKGATPGSGTKDAKKQSGSGTDDASSSSSSDGASKPSGEGSTATSKERSAS